MIHKKARWKITSNVVQPSEVVHAHSLSDQGAEGHCKFEASQAYIVNSRLAIDTHTMTTQQDLVKDQNKTTKNP